MSISTKLLLITWVIILTGAAFAGGYYLGLKKGKNTTQTVSNTPTGDSNIQNSSNIMGNNIMTNLNDTQKKCLQDKMGMTVYTDLTNNKRLPSPDENKKISECGISLASPSGAGKVMEQSTNP